MRERCLPELLRSCYQLTLALHAPQPHLAAGVLQATARYVSWIDIGLVANEQCAPLLCMLPQLLHWLRIAACLCAEVRFWPAEACFWPSTARLRHCIFG